MALARSEIGTLKFVRQLQDFLGIALGGAMLPRCSLFASLQTALARAPVVALLGPRQCGKTTLARQLVPVASANYFDLEDPISLARLEEPLTGLAELRGTVVIDEVQRRPELFPILRVLADRADAPARFLILGSASPALLRQSSESLAGRLEIVEMAGFSLAEVGEEAATSLWLRGGFPRSFLAASEAASLIWRRDFIRTLLESDIPQLGVRVPAATLQRFWAMLAHFHGQLWNGAELGRSLGVNQTTCRRYHDLLEGVFVVRLLQPWHANLPKRQVKAPSPWTGPASELHRPAASATKGPERRRGRDASAGCCAASAGAPSSRHCPHPDSLEGELLGPLLPMPLQELMVAQDSLLLHVQPTARSSRAAVPSRAVISGFGHAHQPWLLRLQDGSAILQGSVFGPTRWLTPVFRTAVRFRSAPFPRSRYRRKPRGAAMVSTGHKEGD